MQYKISKLYLKRFWRYLGGTWVLSSVKYLGSNGVGYGFLEYSSEGIPDIFQWVDSLNAPASEVQTHFSELIPTYSGKWIPDIFQFMDSLNDPVSKHISVSEFRHIPVCGFQTYSMSEFQTYSNE